MSLNSTSNSSFDDLENLPACISLFSTIFVCYILFIPLSLLVLYMGYQRWRTQHCAATSEALSHSDVFTLNMAAVELISISGICMYAYSFYNDHLLTLRIGVDIWSIASPAQSLFHALTCVERYLAVVHPVTYRGLKQSGGVRIRNLIIGGVWLVCFVSPSIYIVVVPFSFVLTLLSCFIVCFCSFSVLRVLIRPGPGDVGANRKGVDQSKRRAFHTIMAIMGALLLRFLGISFYTAVGLSSSYSLCVIVWSLVWLTMPSSLVLPLLFLHRAGKLPTCPRNAVSA